MKPLNEASIATSLSTRWLGQPALVFPVVDSTSDLLSAMAARGQPKGTLLTSDYQMQGKGRHGRQWKAPAGTSILLSLLFRPGWPAKQSTWMTMIGGLAATLAIESLFELPVRLKWPNDLVIHSQDKWLKLGGLLLEGTIRDDRLLDCVLGIGINVNQNIDQLPLPIVPATSIAVELGHNVSRLNLLTTFLENLESLYEKADAGQTPQPKWTEKLITVGQRVTVAIATQRPYLVGHAEGTSDSGHLLVRDDDGKLHPVSAGDVTLRG